MPPRDPAALSWPHAATPAISSTACGHPGRAAQHQRGPADADVRRAPGAACLAGNRRAGAVGGLAGAAAHAREAPGHCHRPRARRLRRFRAALPAAAAGPGRGAGAACHPGFEREPGPAARPRLGCAGGLPAGRRNGGQWVGGRVGGSRRCARAVTGQRGDRAAVALLPRRQRAAPVGRRAAGEAGATGGLAHRHRAAGWRLGPVVLAAGAGRHGPAARPTP
jgi:hypothetical protein